MLLILHNCLLSHQGVDYHFLKDYLDLKLLVGGMLSQITFQLSRMIFMFLFKLFVNFRLVSVGVYMYFVCLVIIKCLCYCMCPSPLLWKEQYCRLFRGGVTGPAGPVLALPILKGWALPSIKSFCAWIVITAAQLNSTPPSFEPIRMKYNTKTTIRPY